MTETEKIKKVRSLAEIYRSYFYEAQPKSERMTIWCIDDRAPQELRQLIYDIHDGALPDDWVFYLIVSALDAIAEDEKEYKDLDSLWERIEAEVDTYVEVTYCGLLAWVSEGSIDRFWWVDRAVEELADGSYPGLAKALMLGMAHEAHFVFTSVLGWLIRQAEDELVPRGKEESSCLESN